MKKSMKIFAIALAIGFSCILISAAPVDEKSILTEENCGKEELTKEVIEDALYCSVTVGENSASCWFCDCRALLKQLQQ